MALSALLNRSESGWQRVTVLDLFGMLRKWNFWLVVKNVWIAVLSLVSWTIVSCYGVLARPSAQCSLHRLQRWEFWSLMNDFVTSVGSPPQPSISLFSCLDSFLSRSPFFSFVFFSSYLSVLSEYLTSAHLSPTRSPPVPPTFPFFIHHFIQHLNLSVCPLILTHFKLVRVPAAHLTCNRTLLHSLCTFYLYSPASCSLRFLLFRILMGHEFPQFF